MALDGGGSRCGFLGAVRDWLTAAVYQGAIRRPVICSEGASPAVHSTPASLTRAPASALLVYFVTPPSETCSMDGNQGPDVVPAGRIGGAETAAAAHTARVLRSAHRRQLDRRSAATDGAGIIERDPGARGPEVRRRGPPGPDRRRVRPVPAPRAGRRRGARGGTRRRGRGADRPGPARIPRQRRPAPGPGQSPRHRNAAHPRRPGNRAAQRMARHPAGARNRLPDRRGPGRRRRANSPPTPAPSTAPETGPSSPRPGPPPTGGTPAPSPSAPRTPPPNGTSASARPRTPWPTSPPCSPSPRASPSTRP